MTGSNIEEEVKRTMESIDDIERAEAPPFLHTRVWVQVEARKKQNSPVMFLLLKPALSVAVLLVTMVLNVYMISQVMVEKKTGSSSKSSSMQIFAKEYGMMSYSVYDKQQ